MQAESAIIFAYARIYLDGLGYAARNAAALEPITLRTCEKRIHRARIVAAVLLALHVCPATSYGRRHWFNAVHLERLAIEVGKRRGAIMAHGIQAPTRTSVLSWLVELLSAFDLTLEEKTDSTGVTVYRLHPESIASALSQSEEDYRRLSPSSAHTPNPSEASLFTVGIRERPQL